MFISNNQSVNYPMTFLGKENIHVQVIFKIIFQETPLYNMSYLTGLKGLAYRLKENLPLIASL